MSRKYDETEYLDKAGSELSDAQDSIRELISSLEELPQESINRIEDIIEELKRKAQYVQNCMDTAKDQIDKVNIDTLAETISESISEDRAEMWYG